ncbi:MAG TPA: LLM class F420-dependent oxidoreductase [Ktedonobacterales bacterium]|nr:LLM class F420-dependent oxidoreductase [Ktedonobacterales bacterium]
MRLGLQVPSFTWPNGQAQLGDTFAHIAREAERAGVYSFWVMDHFYQIRNVGPAENEMLESWTALGFAAGVTNRIKLGTMVTGVTYRNPGLLVKTATTLDVLSHGRAYFGVGAAWNEDEHKGYGVPFPPLKERFERLEDALKLAHQMWEGNDEPFHGKHVTAERPLNNPRQVSRPHPPILIGGGGEQKTLRLVAKYGDACNFFARLGDEVLNHKLDVLRQRCAEVGRSYEAIEKTSLDHSSLTRSGGDGQTAAALVAQCRHLAEMGFDQAIISLRNVSEPQVFDILANEVVPQVSAIEVKGR